VTLCGNAIKFSRSEGGAAHLKITVTPGLKKKKNTVSVLMVVWDNGVGIPKEKQPLLFKSFSAVEPSTSATLEGGAGLRLAMAKQVVDALGGSISVHSEGEGLGTVFKVALDLEETQLDTPEHGLVRTESHTHSWFHQLGEEPGDILSGLDGLEARMHLVLPNGPTRTILEKACRAWGVTISDCPSYEAGEDPSPALLHARRGLALEAWSRSQNRPSSPQAWVMESTAFLTLQTKFQDGLDGSPVIVLACVDEQSALRARESVEETRERRSRPTMMMIMRPIKIRSFCAKLQEVMVPKKIEKELVTPLTPYFPATSPEERTASAESQQNAVHHSGRHPEPENTWASPTAAPAFPRVRTSGESVDRVVGRHLVKMSEGGRRHRDAKDVALCCVRSSSPDETSETERSQGGYPNGFPHLSRILVVDDQAVNRTVAVAMLHRVLGSSAVIDTAVNGFEAISKVTARANTDELPYDCCLMDIAMPMCDGMEATGRIREWEKSRPDGARSYIVAVTAHASVDDAHDCISAGMDRHVAKPLDLARIRDLLARCEEAKIMRYSSLHPAALSSSVDEIKLSKRLELLERMEGSSETNGGCVEDQSIDEPAPAARDDL